MLTLSTATLVLVAFSGQARLAPPPERLLNPSFERGGTEEDDQGPSFVGWSRVNAAKLGEGPSQRIGRSEGRTGEIAVRLFANAETDRFFGLESHAVPAAPGEAWMLSGWMQGRMLRREGRQYDNCGILARAVSSKGETVRVDGYPVVATKPRHGTFAWTEVRRRIFVPEGASALRAGLACTISGEARFDDLSLERIPTARGERIVLHAEAESGELEALLRTAEAALRGAERGAGMRWPADTPLQVHLYLDEEAKVAATGKGGNAHVEPPDRIHTLRAALGSPHEHVHLLAAHHLNANPAALLGEGLAVAAGGTWQGEPVDRVARRLRARDQLPGLGDVLPTQRFRELPEGISYPLSGSFTRHLLARCGPEGYAELYRRSRVDDDLKGLSGKVAQTCRGQSLEDLFASWREALEAR